MIKRMVVIVAVAAAVLFMAVAAMSQFYTDLLWFSSLEFASVFWITLLWERAVPFAVFLLFAGFFFANLSFTRKDLMQLLWRTPQAAQNITPLHITLVFAGSSLLLGFFAAAGTSLYAMEAAQFFNASSFGVQDPVFGRDVGFYFFQLPFYRVVLGLLRGFLLPALVVCGVIYGVAGQIRFRGITVHGSKRALGHLSVLAAGFCVLQAGSYLLAVYDLMYSAGGAVYGPGYTDMTVRVVVFRILAVLALAAAAALVLGGRRRITAFGAALALWLLVSVVGGGVVPGLVQAWMVEPNEYSREEPYIVNHIAMTRAAFGLDSFQTVEFAGDQVLNWDILNDNWATIENVRLWDPRPLLQTYSQLQEMRLYYRFYDADIGRYTVDGQYRQVLLSARELDIAQIQNRTWINEHLQYTHGYGVVMSPVNEATRQGIPEFWIADIPPRSRIGIEISQPRIYFGERTNQYVIVNTVADEFDYPLGDQNAFYRYTGDDGVPISNLLRRIAFALRFGESRILLSTEISGESRMLYKRNILERVNTIAPFLRYDQDPYLTIVDGRLYWVNDCYNTSFAYPYSQPARNWGNYVRNSVKVVVDAYNGRPVFYQVEDDPLLETYASIFPDLFEPLNAMPDAFREHIRYPEDLLQLQAEKYGIYHMQNTRVFYNQEDVWHIATELYGQREQAVEPYYVMLQLPGEAMEELVLMIPFTPIRRSNMVAWMAGRSDGENYGDVIVYTFPKDSLTLGPAQIEARIDQDSDISQLLSLWGQRGSQVIRGNMLVLPVAEGLLYVEPLYLQSDQSGMPQLQRVIVAHGDDLVMEETLALALARLFGEMPGGELASLLQDELRSDTTPSDLPAEFGELGLDLPQQAVAAYREAAAALERGDFAAFGEAWYELERILQRWEDSAQTL